MKCPYCSSRDTKVIDKRDTEAITRRRRECLTCERRFTTYERAEVLDLYVLKKDGRREGFDRQKLRRGILKACEKRPVSPPDIDKALGEIEQQLLAKRSNEVSHRTLGELVMEALRNLDKVAYIRFASVYRDFKDADDFEREIRELRDHA